jgi:hypothetical protein
MITLTQLILLTPSKTLKNKLSSEHWGYFFKMLSYKQNFISMINFVRKDFQKKIIFYILLHFRQERLNILENFRNQMINLNYIFISF